MASDPSLNLLAKVGRHLAHELNNPISAISSSVYLIEDMIASGDGTVQTEEIRPFVQSIQEECATLKATVEEFTRFATTEKILPARIDLAEFVRARAEDMAREGWPVTAEVRPEPCHVNADSGALAYVLRALAEGAKSEGATNIHFILSNDSCEITMTDNRPDPKDIASGFSAESVATRMRGTGLGLKLPLAKKIIELHGGTIEVLPANGGETKIKITLLQERAV